MKALELKGLDYQLVELPPAVHAAVAKVVFGERTVPALIVDRGEKVSGSRAILRRLDALAPDPPLLPAEPAAREAVLEAERWGDETFQQVARRVIWTAFARRTEAMASYQEGRRPGAAPLPPRRRHHAGRRAQPGVARGGPARRTPSSRGRRASASARRSPAGVASSKSSSSRGTRTKRRART